jgi:GNAT superfamily N-acetyltransferase
MTMNINRADASHLDVLVPLFTGYRVFYERPARPAADRAFLEDRFRLQDSVIFIALPEDASGQAVGFAQLYSSFDSVDLSPIWILHDLFVAESERRRGTGRRLMNAASDYCRQTEAVRVDLATAVKNTSAQALYESLGYERDEDFFHYSLML